MRDAVARGAGASFSAVGICLCLSLAANPAWAGSFQLNERSTKALGASLAGSVSAASDITFIGFNPAALSQVKTMSLGGSFALVAPISEATVRTGASAGAQADADSARLVPGNAAGFRPFADLGLVFGFAAYSPFGLVTKYPNTFPSAFDAITSELTTINVSPMVAYEVMPGLSFGAALNILYVDARLTSGFLNLDGSTVDFGFSVGAHWEPVKGTKLGLAWHQGHDISIDGAHQSAILGTSAEAVVSSNLPGYMLAGITQDITEDFRVMGEFRYIRWSAFSSIDVETPSFPPPLNSLSEEQNYEDAYFGAIGAEADFMDDRLVLRAGVAYDDTPTTDEFRTPRVPDANRLWLSAGASFSPNDHMTLDISYSYLYALDTSTVEIRNGPAAGDIVEYDGGAHILSLGAELRF